MPHTHPIKYRKDIDGLRAIAVLSVVLFHAFPALLPGGFIGVDVFFVISGFLISGIILKDLDAGSFSFADFYGRRIRRIFPSLIILLSFCYLAGWFLLLDKEFRDLNRNLVGGAGFVSNLVLWKESGYFDAAAEIKPLLNLWSLGIEEQFYIIWPALIFLAYQFKSKLLPLICAAALASFGFNLWYLGQHNQTADFYSPLARFWELCAGALIAYAQRQRQAAPAAGGRGRSGPAAPLKDILSVAGLLLIAGCFFLINKEKFYPSYWALLPVLGAALLFIAGEQALVNRTVLSAPPLVWIGLISFPLYLWHWPLLTFPRILLGQTPSPAVRIAAILCAVVLSAASYYYVEKKLRFGGSLRSKTVGLCLLMVALVGVALASNSNRYAPSRYVVEHTETIDRDPYGALAGLTVNECGRFHNLSGADYGFCLKDVRQAPVNAMIGDSKAQSLFAGVLRTSREGGRWLVMGGFNPTYGSPIPMVGDIGNLSADHTLIANSLMSVAADANIKTVTLVTATRNLFGIASVSSMEELPHKDNLDAVFRAVSNSVRYLTQHHKKVVLVVDNPTLLDPKDCVQRQTRFEFINNYMLGNARQGCSVSIARHRQLTENYSKLIAMLKQEFPADFHVFDTLAYFCDPADSLCKPSRNGKQLYAYSDHMSDYSAGLIGSDLNAFVAQLNQP